MASRSQKASPIPTKVEVGPYTFTIKLVSDAGDYIDGSGSQEHTYGCCSFKEMTIYLSEDQHPMMMKDTILHEINHVIWGVVGGWASEINEEVVISMLTTTQLETLKKNKELFKYLMED